ncbi:DUF6318 family protein, partial [Buchananella hordeovulneris]|uniref:DUF6318 family protein n=1 Tax=Buchananella hordeovulneris TaxID=52770 RepID=UPI00130100F1
LPPEAQAQAGFAEAELAAKYFVELQYYVAQTNDLATWEQVIHPESPSGKQVIENTHKRQADLVRLVHEGLSISPLRAEQGQEDADLFRVFLEVHMADELTVSSDGREIDSDGDRTLYVTSYVKHLEGRWILVDSSFSEERPEGL